VNGKRGRREVIRRVLCWPRRKVGQKEGGAGKRELQVRRRLELTPNGGAEGREKRLVEELTKKGKGRPGRNNKWGKKEGRRVTDKLRGGYPSIMPRQSGQYVGNRRLIERERACVGGGQS